MNYISVLLLKQNEADNELDANKNGTSERENTQINIAFHLNYNSVLLLDMSL